MLDYLQRTCTIKGKTMKNRMAVSAMVTNYCNDDGTATERYLAYHEEKAKGGWGLIITEDYGIAPEGHGFKYIPGLWDDRQIPGHSELPKRVHKYGAVILAQIYHCGRQTNKDAIHGRQVRSSSPIMCPFGDDIPKPFTTEEVKETVKKFGDAALRAKKCGFDGVEIHGAHGYLITQFFSLYSNKRIDEYGGNFWNRTRFAREIVQDIKEKCGDDFIIGMRLSVEEFVDGGLTIEDSKAIARMMESCGVDLLHLSLGNYLSADLFIASHYTDHGWIADYARAIKDVVSIPVMVVSRINDPFVADSILSSGYADFVAMGRASLADPELPNKTFEGRFEDIRGCIGCNRGCIGNLLAGKSVQCVLNPRLGREWEPQPPVSVRAKNVLIAGAGPAGLMAAIAAAKAGHYVTVYEKEAHAGGQFYYAAFPPCKGEITGFLVWLQTQCSKLGVRICYNSELTVEKVKELRPDKIILATGAVTKRPPFDGLDTTEKCVTALDILGGKVITGANCVIIGGGEVGAETAHFLAQMLRKVTILEEREAIASDAPLAINIQLNQALDKFGVVKMTETSVRYVSDYGVQAVRKKGGEIFLKADTIVLAAGRSSCNPLEAELKAAGIACEVIGDAKNPASVLEAVHAGYALGQNV